MFNFKKTQLIYGSIIILLFLGICAVYYCIVLFHLDSQTLSQKNKGSLTYQQIKVQKVNAVLNKEMKQWLSKKENLNGKYYKIIVKGFGSTGELQKGYGTIKSNIKKFYAKQGQFVMQGDILKFNGMIFCGCWEVIPVTPQDYIYNIINNALQ